MCGIAGVLYKNQAADAEVGQALIAMLDGCQHRGPDSTGFALYHDAEPGDLRLRFIVGTNGTSQASVDKIKAKLEEFQALILEENRTGSTYAVKVRFTGDIQKLAYAMEQVAKLSSIGESLDIVKDLGYIAFGQHSGAIGPLSNRQALPRFPVAEPFADMAAFKTKALSLAMPVILQEPVDPQTSEPNPLLTVTLAPVEGDPNRLTCYFGAERMKIQWLVPDEKFSIQSEKSLPPGRSRYNCTLPHDSGGRFYWFSHQWISPTPQ